MHQHLLDTTGRLEYHVKVLGVMRTLDRAATRPDCLQAAQQHLKPASHAEQDRRPMQITDGRLVHGTPLFKALLADLQLAMAYRPPLHTRSLLCLDPIGEKQKLQHVLAVHSLHTSMHRLICRALADNK